ncbi:MAG TPA: acyl-CoA dehydrogenase family protein [Solirubrobacteraceae bacterium]|jgi:acyl-CoA dehydrogenase|nr:acyl-CoA dehydrogenase family protein [Solirubrobacteraceae bacterium]
MTLAQALAVLRERGPDRAAEMVVLGEWLLAQAGLSGDAGAVTVAPGSARDSVELRGGRVSGCAHRVPWARDAARIAILLDGRALVVDRADVSIEPHVNLAGDVRDTVVFDGAGARSGPGVDAEALFLRGALMRIALMAGALDALYEIVVRHAGERHQFGRPIGSFQAVQQHLVTIAQQVAMAGVAAEASAQRTGGFEIAAGKLLANHAALSAGRAAHQVLGARGTTREHPLGQLTRRLWAWRSEYGDEHHWSTRLGAGVASAGADSLYPAITGGSTVVSL